MHCQIGFLRSVRLLVVALTVGVTGLATAADALRIEHAPIHTGLVGQSITVRARVSDPAPKSVTLFFATSRDAAPYKVPMTSSGPQIYAGSIPESQLTRVREIYYYIEARDAADNVVESPWYTVALQLEAQDGDAGAGVKPTGGKSKGDSKESSWVKPALIGGGLLAAGGIAYAASSGGGGGGGDDGGGTSEYAGTYTGTDTTCTQAPGGSTTCLSSGLTITITDQGVVQTSDLRDGQRLEQTLSGDSFVLVANVNENGFTGEIQYFGTVVDRRIVGSIQGSASSAAGVAVFSGTFSALR